MKPARHVFRPVPPAPRRDRGFVLIAALAVLLMLTFLSVGMFRSFGLEERITGNSREKQHAFFAAQSALQYAENWLQQSSSGATGIACTATTTSSTPAICNATTSTLPSTFNLATSDWHSTFGTTYQPAQITTTAATTGTAQVTYADPQFAITYLGTAPGGQGGLLYQVTSLGFGGYANAAAVVQSAYVLTPVTQNPMAPN
jgi:type IV pilus assembly protein PilX